MNDMDMDAVIDKLKRSLDNLMAVYVFGSRAHGEPGPDSDLDIAVLMEGRADPVSLFFIAGDIASLVGCDVDLLDLRNASTVMQYQVVTTGNLLWSVGRGVDSFECFVLSSKTELDCANAALIADITKEGHVYAR